jgi:hypothetical protein
VNLRTARAGKLGCLVAGGLAVGVLAAPSAAPAATTKFGAKLSNAPSVTPAPRECVPVAGPGCTRVGVAYGATGAAGGNVAARRKGTIKRIRLIASAPGNFRLFVARVRDLNLPLGTGRARVTRKGPRIEYEGNGLTSRPVERFEVGLKVKARELLAIRARSTSTLDCRGTTPNELLYQPPLGLGEPLDPSDGSGTCQLLLQAVVK